MSTEHMSLEEFKKLSLEREKKFTKGKRSPPKKKADGTPRRKPTQWEASDQESLMVWLAAQRQCKTILAPVLDAIYHVPNGGYRDFKTAGEMKKQGVKRGVSDLVLPIARGGYFGLYIEFKAARPHNASLDECQRDWLHRVESEGYAATLAVGKEEAKEILLNYMSLPPTIREVLPCVLGGTDWRNNDGKAKGK